MADEGMDLNLSSPALSEAIEKIMANPEIISMVASAFGGKQQEPPKAEEKNETASEEKAADLPVPTSMSIPSGFGDIISSLAPLLSAKGTDKGKDRDHGRDEAHKREALLCALKPYVSNGRQEVIDQIIRLSQITDLLKHMK